MDSSQPSNISQKAIDAALSGSWEEALKLNKQIIKTEPGNVDALNRQAKAYLELGKINLSKKYYSEVLKFDPYNPIAQKNLKIIKSSKPNCNIREKFCQDKLSPSMFLQEPGKTKIVSLLNIAEPQKLSLVHPGMRTEMLVKNRKITIVDPSGNYLGVLPDDISHHLCKLFKGGNKYDLYVKSIRVNSLSIIIKETFRSKRFKNQPSFLDFNDNVVPANIITNLDNHSEEDAEDEADQET